MLLHSIHLDVCSCISSQSLKISIAIIKWRLSLCHDFSLIQNGGGEEEVVTSRFSSIFGKVSTNRRKLKADDKIGWFKFWKSNKRKEYEGDKRNKKVLIRKMADNKKSLVDEILGDLSKASAAKQIALGTASGWLTGFVTMKVGKVAAVAVGGGILILQIAQHKGYIKINWEKIQKSADKVVDKIEKDLTGNEPDIIDKLSRYVDRKLDKAEDALRKNERKARRWYHSFINNNGHGGYELQELHLFIASFAAGVTFGFATA